MDDRRQERELQEFWPEVRRAPARGLLLDYDGTLAPFRPERDQAVPYPGVRDLLQAILDDGRTRLVVISGRAARELPPLLGLERPPEIWGTHGWERLMPDGSYQLAPIHPGARTALDQAWAWIAGHKLIEHAERKPASVALHWRGLPESDAEALRAAAERAWSELAAGNSIHLAPFDGGLELRAAGQDKGVAVRTLIDELGAGALIAYLGDDRTDEDAFSALDGRGLGVLVRPEHRPTAARLWLRPPDELLDFLQMWRSAAAPPTTHARS